MKNRKKKKGAENATLLCVSDNRLLSRAATSNSTSNRPKRFWSSSGFVSIRGKGVGGLTLLLLLDRKLKTRPATWSGSGVQHTHKWPCSHKSSTRDTLFFAFSLLSTCLIFDQIKQINPIETYQIKSIFIHEISIQTTHRNMVGNDSISYVERDCRHHGNSDFSSFSFG